jgi:hypothetical protein
MTDEQKEAAQKFLTAYGELVKKHGFDFATYPMFVPDGQGGFKIIVQSTPVPHRPKEEKVIVKE